MYAQFLMSQSVKVLLCLTPRNKSDWYSLMPANYCHFFVFQSVILLFFCVYKFHTNPVSCFVYSIPNDGVVFFTQYTCCTLFNYLIYLAAREKKFVWQDEKKMTSVFSRNIWAQLKMAIGWSGIMCMNMKTHHTIAYWCTVHLMVSERMLPAGARKKSKVNKSNKSHPHNNLPICVFLSFAMWTVSFFFLSQLTSSLFSVYVSLPLFFWTPSACV